MSNTDTSIDQIKQSSLNETTIVQPQNDIKNTIVQPLQQFKNNIQRTKSMQSLLKETNIGHPQHDMKNTIVQQLAENKNDIPRTNSLIIELSNTDTSIDQIKQSSLIETSIVQPLQENKNNIHRIKSLNNEGSNHNTTIEQQKKLRVYAEITSIINTNPNDFVIYTRQFFLMPSKSNIPLDVITRVIQQVHDSNIHLILYNLDGKYLDIGLYRRAMIHTQHYWCCICIHNQSQLHFPSIKEALRHWNVFHAKHYFFYEFMVQTGTLPIGLRPGHGKRRCSKKYSVTSKKILKIIFFF